MVTIGEANEKDLQQILDIYNGIILNTTAISILPATLEQCKNGLHKSKKKIFLYLLRRTFANEINIIR